MEALEFADASCGSDTGVHLAYLLWVLAKEFFCCSLEVDIDVVVAESSSRQHEENGKPSAIPCLGEARERRCAQLALDVLRKLEFLNGWHADMQSRGSRFFRPQLLSIFKLLACQLQLPFFVCCFRDFPAE